VAYALLREAIEGVNKIGIAKFIMREVQHLAAVEVVGDALVLSTLRFADELVDVDTLKLPKKVSARGKELEMAKSLVESLAADWDPGKYTDDYRDNLMKVIRAKMKGKEAHLEPETVERDSNVVDLMERLRQSLDAAKKGGGTKSRTTRSHAGAKKKTAGKRHRAA
jgi:DNA end-binding protein Ku